MSAFAKTGRRFAKLAAVPLIIASLAACAPAFNANVSRFATQLPAPQGQTFAVVADDPRLAGGLEFSQYARSVEDQMARLGYTPVASPAQANLIVKFDYGVDKGRERIQSSGFSDPFYSPWSGYRGGLGGGFGGYRGGYRGGYGGYRGGYGSSIGIGYGNSWGYGLYDPFFSNGIESYTVYTSGIDLKIDRRVDGQRLFEGKAEALSTSNRLQYLVPNLVEAMFTDFPGHNGETVRISVAPEKYQRR